MGMPTAIASQAIVLSIAAAVWSVLHNGLGSLGFEYSFPRNTTRLACQEDITAIDYMRTTVYFPSHGDRLEGWFYQPLPTSEVQPPVIIMGHGLGAQKDMSLHPYAEQFAQAGMAVLVIDYRGFGGSDGEVRHWVTWTRHTQDYQAALDFVLSGGLGEGRLDLERVALWGISYSGGHALVTAAKEANHGKVKAVVANEPYLLGTGNIAKAVADRPLHVVARLLLAGVVDKIRELSGRGPVYVKLVGDMDGLAVLGMNPQELAFSRGNQTGPPIRIGGWKNLVTARFLIDNLGYKPMSHVDKLQCPVLLIGGTKDYLCPIENIRKAAELIGDKALVLERPYGHIELHKRGTDPEELAPVIEWLRRQFGMQPDHVDTHPLEPPEEAEGTVEVA